MADKQTGTGARGRGNKSPEGRRDDATNNPVSTKNRSQQKKAVNRSTGGRNAKQGRPGSD
jgi:hypothetical protein